MSDERISGLMDEARRLRYSRRSVLKRASVLGLSSTALSAAVNRQYGAAAPNRAPAFLQGSSLTILASTYFVTAAEDFFREQVAAWGEENSVDVEVDLVNWPDLQPRIAAAVEGGSGPDVIEMWDAWPYLYSNQMVQVQDLAEQIGTDQGGYFDWVTRTAAVDGEWFSVPIGASNIGLAYRISYLEEAGLEDPRNNPPTTWEQLFELGRNLKEMGKPLGQALGNSLGDPPGFAYPYMWSHGAMELDGDGNIAINTESFVTALSNFVDAWGYAYDDTGLGWDDATNNRAYLSDQVGATLNGSSVLITARTENPEISEDSWATRVPGGPEGQFNALGSRSYAAMSYSENQDAAVNFLEWWTAADNGANLQAWYEAFDGYIAPATQMMSELPVYTVDEQLAPFNVVAQYGRNKGYMGPSNQQAAQVSAQNLIVNCFANAIQSGDAETAVADTERQLERIYNR